jgi:four helix bundle protein
MTNDQSPVTRKFDLEGRTTEFACKVIRLCKKLPRNPINNRLVGQIIGSSGSTGVNYREANDALGKKDFIYRLKIACREAKETSHWLILLKEANQGKEEEFQSLIEEAGIQKYILFYNPKNRVIDHESPNCLLCFQYLGIGIWNLFDYCILVMIFDFMDISVKIFFRKAKL